MKHPVSHTFKTKNFADTFSSFLGQHFFRATLSVYGSFLDFMSWLACIVFMVMGTLLIVKSDKSLGAKGEHFTKPGIWTGLVVGAASVIGNPKAILFYMGVLPGFFNLTKVTVVDIAIIGLISALVPMLGNLLLALFLGRVRMLLQNPRRLRKLNIFSGMMLIAVGLIIPFI